MTDEFRSQKDGKKYTVLCLDDEKKTLSIKRKEDGLVLTTSTEIFKEMVGTAKFIKVEYYENKGQGSQQNHYHAKFIRHQEAP